MCLGVFKIFASSLLTRILVFCVTLWQPAVLYSVLVLYLRTHSILNSTYIKGCKHYNKKFCHFHNQFSALSHYIGSTYKESSTFEKELG